MLATTVLLLLLGWLCWTAVMAILAAPPREEIHRATAGPARTATPPDRPPLASEATAPQPRMTLP